MLVDLCNEVVLVFVNEQATSQVSCMLYKSSEWYGLNLQYDINSIQWLTFSKSHGHTVLSAAVNEPGSRKPHRNPQQTAKCHRQ